MSSIHENGSQGNLARPRGADLFGLALTFDQARVLFNAALFGLYRGGYAGPKDPAIVKEVRDQLNSLGLRLLEDI